MRRFSSLVSKSSPQAQSFGGSASTDCDDSSDARSESKMSIATAVVRDEQLPVPSLKVKRVDHYYSKWSKSWKYKVSRHPPH